MSVKPIRWVTLPRWLTRGIFSSVGWLPFLNCACTLPARRPNPANPKQSPRTHFDILRINAPSFLTHFDLASAPSFAAGHPRFGGTASPPFGEQEERRKQLRLPAACRRFRKTLEEIRRVTRGKT